MNHFIQVANHTYNYIRLSDLLAVDLLDDNS